MSHKFSRCIEHCVQHCSAMSIINITIFIRKFSTKSYLFVALRLGFAAIYEEHEGSLDIKKSVYMLALILLTLPLFSRED